MGASGKAEYYYCRLYLYPPRLPARAVPKPFGTAEIEVCGHEGYLLCRIARLPEEPAQGDLSGICKVMLDRAGEKQYIGHIAANPPGYTTCRWNFAVNGATEGRPVMYKLLVLAGTEADDRADGNSRVVLEGRFSLLGEVRDKRVVGFKKEGKASKKDRAGLPANPLFHRVEPFDPPLADCHWWQISIQPNTNGICRPDVYCPRSMARRVN